MFARTEASDQWFIRAKDCAWMPRAIEINTSKRFHPFVVHSSLMPQRLSD